MQVASEVSGLLSEMYIEPANKTEINLQNGIRFNANHELSKSLSLRIQTNVKIESQALKSMSKIRIGPFANLAEHRRICLIQSHRLVQPKWHF